MKSLSSTTYQGNSYLPAPLKTVLSGLASSAREAVAFSASLLAAATVIMLFIWAAGLHSGTFLCAGTWGLGFIFLAMALDDHGLSAIAQAATGVTLLTLALLQSAVSPDYIIVAGIILSGWVAVVLFRYLSHKGR